MEIVNKNNRINVTVGMSGGVDSSVAAMLLVEKGYQVSGVMLRLFEPYKINNQISNGFEQARDQAERVARQIGIPFQLIDATSEFKQAVIDYFIRSHKSGITPNPCFVCNRTIKWGLLLDKARSLGANKLASGHYARIIRAEDGVYELYRAKDLSKDQSYVLSGLNQKQLAHVLFPLGETTKNETREIAHRYDFPTRDQEESQDLCFLEGLTQEEYLERNAGDLFVKGEIKNLDGKVLGEHNGLVNYTVGQRKRIRVSSAEPLYVLRKDVENNVVIVGAKEQLGTRRIRITDVNWVSGSHPHLPATYQTKIRYQSAFYQASVSKTSATEYDIIFEDIIRDPTPGQYAVFYKGEMVVGSGIIIKTHVGEET